MTRARTGQRAPSRGPGFDPDIPVEGCYRVRLRKGAHDSAVRIWLGAAIGPDGEEMTERPLSWQCELNGARCDYLTFWPACAREAISRAEHDRLAARNQTMDADSVFYSPTKPIDISTAPPPF